MKEYLKEHINDFNPAVKIFKREFRREPLDLDELLDFLITLKIEDLTPLFDK